MMRGVWVTLCVLVFLTIQANAAVTNFIKNCTDCEIVTGAWPTRSSAVMATDDGRVWRSTDEGITWTQMLRWMKINEIVAQNSTTLYFFPWSGKNLVYSADGGATLVNSTLPAPRGQIVNIQPHPTNSGWLMLGTCNSGNIVCSLYTTKNYGQNWTATFTNGLGPDAYCLWGNATDQPDLIFAIKSDGFFGFTTNYGKSWSPLLSNAAGFVQTQHYMFVGVRSGASVKLFASSSRVDPSHRHGYALAQFPSGSSIADDYSFLDDVTRAEYLGVHPKSAKDPQPIWGSIYNSEFDGAYYQMALDHVYYDGGVYDFHRFNGLAGLYLANIVANWESTTAAPKKMTVITYDNGADWRFLKAPKTDMNGNNWPCSGCALHIHADSSSRQSQVANPYNTFPGWRTHASAIGIIFANGNVGTYLSYVPNEVSTFLSRDAGLTWTQIFAQPTVFEFGDHAGILLMAPALTPVTNLWYSFDQGATFSQLVFTTVPMTVASIITEPGGTGERFIINAWTGDSITVAKWSIFGIDLSDFPIRTCGPADFEQFTPVNPEENQACFMGATTTYTRRSRTAVCYNINPVTDQPTSQVPCACEWEDYECDYNYASTWRNSTDGFNCTQIYAPINCAEGSEFYWKQTGYSLVPDTLCDPTAKDALNLVAPKISCHEKSKKHGAETAAAVVVTLLIVGAIVAVGVLYWKNERFHAWVNSLKPKGSSSQRYAIVHQDEHDQDDDEA